MEILVVHLLEGLTMHPPYYYWVHILDIVLCSRSHIPITIKAK